ncbi:MAG: phosphate ABC transporter permease subunit PstC [Hyphomicrobium sp.]|nr:phosphate ABC transporter permease subunit PstC [Hyphomicrobium sp.]
MTVVYFTALALLTLTAYVLASRRSVALSATGVRMHSLPAYHGLLAISLVIAPMLLIWAVGTPLVSQLAASNALTNFPAEIRNDALQAGSALREIKNLAAGQHSGDVSDALRAATDTYSAWRTSGNFLLLIIGLTAALAGIATSLRMVSGQFRARNHFERIVRIVLMACAGVAVLTTIGIVASVLTETIRFFFDPNIKGRPGILDFLFGTEWNPQQAMRADQGDIKSAYGFVPLLTGTLLITAIAMCVAGPLGLLSAIYLAEYASPRMRRYAKPVLEILAGVPTVVLGFFAALTVAPYIRGWGEALGLDVASESALAAGLVMGMMIIPFISSLSDDVMNAVPQSLRDGAYALGATKSEAIKQVVLPAALPGIVSAFMLAMSRAIGETMIVVMAAGLAANLTLNPLDAVTTITVQIKTILVGDQEFDSAKTLAAFALGFVLFFITLILNIIALRIVRKYREQYD